MRETATHVYFWGGPLSQWYKAPFDLALRDTSRVRRFTCAEQYMMAEKALLFGNDASLEAILAAPNPKRQKALGRAVRGYDDARRRAAAFDAIVRGNEAKFSQNAALRGYLLGTAPKKIVEGSPTDRIYGVGLRYDDPAIDDEANWRGENLLGKALAVVRARLAS